MIDEIENTGRRGKLSIISFIQRKLNPNNEGLHHKQKCTVLRFVHCCADWSSGAGQQSVPAPQLAPRADFLSILSSWRSAYPPRQFFLEFYDTLEADPADLLRRVYEFLGVDASPQRVPLDVLERRNAAVARPIPHELHVALCEKYEPQLEALSALLGGPAIQWLQQARAVLAESRRR